MKDLDVTMSIVVATELTVLMAVSKHPLEHFALARLEKFLTQLILKYVKTWMNASHLESVHSTVPILKEVITAVVMMGMS